MRAKRQQEKGTVLVFVALMLPLLVFFSGIAIDFGRAYMHKSSLQSEADAAALAGVAKVGNGRARLVKVEDIPASSSSLYSAVKAEADRAANVILAKGSGGADGLLTDLRIVILDKEDPRLAGRVQNYYYEVELSEAIDFTFAKLFLPASFLPKDWKVNVQAWAMAKAKGSADLSGKSLLDQMKDVADLETVASFQALQKENPGKSYDYIKSISFTNKGVSYFADGSRQEIFTLNGDDSLTNGMKHLLINFKPDIISSTKLEDNWDLDTLAGWGDTAVKNYFNNHKMKFTNWQIYDNDGNLVSLSEGGVKNWQDFFNLLKNTFGEAGAQQLVRQRIESVINVDQAYEVRDVAHLPQTDISYDVNGDRNLQDPLFIRIESEEYNQQSGSNFVTNSIRDITINIRADNTVQDGSGNYIYRPMLFFYDGPVDQDGDRGKGRKSRTVVLNLEEDFRGIIYAPNSPVCIQINGADIKFTGIIIAARLVDADGNEISMPSHQDESTDAILQAFYHDQLGLRDAQFDTFGVAGLTIYENPLKDIAYLTERAAETK
ncbi:Putative Flp pilus-assembly TadE/G-like [Selenomonas ruminantium]|uniref:Putative Flp pilus-assembly TadE/G-like n=1 Tax=Selenomonas ruminantium TaxID=971 RepID=A0A1M6S461_SELRU|nr:pilus assembly protein TadG-related protein [Selenomonas ruminantium]SHK39471.1 Putative Flp pilus-assembly TadE/G-like [Selenomonas ruminantium]